MTDKIKAVGFYQHLPISNSNSFEDLTIDQQTVGPHDLLVQVAGVSVNPVDTVIRNGGRKNRMNNPKIIGWDSVGTVIKIGHKVSLFSEGDRVWYAGDFKRSGSNSQTQIVDEHIVGFAPSNLNDKQAAAVPLVGLTAYESLFEQLGVDRTGNEGKIILIVNGAGGVGSMAVQLAKLSGLTVISTASKKASIDWVNNLGADYVIDHHQDLVSQVHNLDIKYVDYALNLNNLDAHWNELSELIKPDGKIAATTENRHLIDLQKLTKKRVTFSWEWMYSKSYYHLDTMITQHEILDEISKLYENYKLLPIDTINYSPINASNMRKAHADVESGSMVGKVTLVGWEK